jgi:glutamate synthase (NADPH/NADH) large chain
VLKIMSKMGISVVGSYAGAQAFEAIGLSQEFVDQYFTGTTSLSAVSDSTSSRRERAPAPRRLPAGRRDAWCTSASGRRRVPVAPRGPAAPVQPGHRVPAAARDARAPVRHLPRLHRLIDEQAENLMTLRGLFKLKEGRIPPSRSTRSNRSSRSSAGSTRAR